MDSTSIWDIYSSAKKLLPLYERMQNRSIRQESRSIQTSKKEVQNSALDSMLSSTNSSMNSSNPTADFNMNYMNNEDILSVDLLTPLSASPAAIVSASGKQLKNFNQNDNTNNNTNTNSNRNNSGSNATNNSSNNNVNNNMSNTANGNNNMITPTSITESPNSTNNMGIKLAANSNSNDKMFDPFKSYAFADIVDFKNDEDISSSEVDFDILRELKRINESNNLNFQPTQTIRPLDIKIKSESSISINNQNILSTNDNNNTISSFENEKKNVNNENNVIKNEAMSSESTPTGMTPNKSIYENGRMINATTNTGTTPSTMSNTFQNKIKDTPIINNKQKFIKMESDSPSPSSHPRMGSTSQPNELQTQARQSKSTISSSAPTKENIKSISKCSNCGTTKTPLWRKDPNGNTLCNACGLFLKLHGTMRPLSLKTDVIKKRNSKRQSLGAQGEGYKNLSHMTPNPKSSSQSPNPSMYFPQSFPNSNINNFGVTGPNQPPVQSPHQLQYIQPQPGLSNSQSKTFVPVHSQSQIPVNSGNQSQNRSKIVPILPKPSRDSSSPNQNFNAINFNFSIGASPSQPQDIPQFKRRKSRLNLSSSQNSQPPSPLTAINTGTSYSPSSSVTYSPVTNMTASSPAHASSPAGGVLLVSRSLSRQNSISSNSSHNLYQDLNNKRGLTYNNVNQIANGTPTNSIISNSYNNTMNNNVISGNSNSSPSNSSGNSNLSVNKCSQQRQQKPSNFSNLSAGMNAIRISSAGKSGLSKCLANVNDKPQAMQKSLKINNKNSTNLSPFDGGSKNNIDTGINMDDLDWLKFDI